MKGSNSTGDHVSLSSLDSCYLCDKGLELKQVLLIVLLLYYKIVVYHL